MSARNEGSDAAVEARAFRKRATEQRRAAEDAVRTTLAQSIATKTALGQDTAEDEARLRAVEERHAARRVREVEPVTKDEHQRPEARGEVLATPEGVVGPPARFAELAAQADLFAETARAKNTRRAYVSDWKHFANWCEIGGLTALPAHPMTVRLYLTELACTCPPEPPRLPTTPPPTTPRQTYRVATLVRRLSAISTAHQMAGEHLDTRHPLIRDTMTGIRRAKGVAQRQAAPLTIDPLRAVLATCGDRLIDIRDRALLVIGYAAALRQSEIVALDVADLTVSREGLRVVIRRSKADQEGAGAVLAVDRTGTPTCPVAAYMAWLEASGITAGAVFRRVDRHSRLLDARLQPEAVADLIRDRATRAGLDASETYTGHSLRAGFVTMAASNRVPEREIMLQTRHRSHATLRRYVREGEMWDRRFAARVGL
jgi:integrase